MSNTNDHSEADFDPNNVPDWIRYIEENKKLKAQIVILEDQLKYLIDNANDQSDTIERLTKKHYHIANDSNRLLLRIMEEIFNINIILTGYFKGKTRIKDGKKTKK